MLEHLATAGAFTGFGLSRREALWAAAALADVDDGHLPGTAAPVEAPDLPTMTPVEQTIADLWSTGSSVDSHPVQHLREHLTDCGALPAKTVPELPDRTPLLIGGLVTERRRPPTAKGVCFLMIEDETGMTNVIVPPPVWETHKKPRSSTPGSWCADTSSAATAAPSISSRASCPRSS